jgi:hypothetical protein
MFDYEKLQKALYEIERIHKFSEVTKKSRVHNIRRIADGTNTPTIKNWVKLHRAFPEHIPEPTYIDGGKVFKNINTDNNSKMAGGNIVNMPLGVSLSSAEQALIDGLRKLGDKEDETIFEFLGMISKMLKNQ